MSSHSKLAAVITPNVNSNENFLKFPSDERTPGKREVIETREQWFPSTNIQSFSVNVYIHGDSVDGGGSPKYNVFCF